MFRVAHLFALQSIVSGAQHRALKTITQNTGNWVDETSIQDTYNKAAMPGSDQLAQVTGRSNVFYSVPSSNSPKSSR